MCRSKNLIEGCLQKVFLTEQGLTDKGFCKTALLRRFTCYVIPKRFSLARVLWFAPLWNSAAEILQCKAVAFGFRSLHIISNCLREDYLYSDTCQDYRYFTSQMFEAFPAQIPTFFEKTFRCLILSQAITLEPICGSAFFPLACPANAPLLDCRRWLANFTLYWYTVIQDFESCDHKDFKHQLNTCHILPLWQINAKTSPFKFILLDGLILKLQFQKLLWSLGFIEISPFHELIVSDPLKVLEADDNMKS